MSHELPLLVYQAGRLLMDRRARAQGIPTTRTIAEAYRVSGPLDQSALESAFAYVVARHEALRTSFTEQDTQIVHDEAPIAVLHVDLSTDPESAAEDLARSEANRDFAPNELPRLRITAARLGTDEHVAIVVLDHLMVDAWSRGLVLTELSQAYASYARGDEPRFAPVLYSYRDHIHDQQTLLSSADYASLLERWRSVLGGRGAVVPLRLCTPAPTRKAPSSGIISRTVAEEVATGFAALAAVERATPFMLLLTVLQTVLSAHTPDWDQPVAVNVYNRDTMGTEVLVAPLAELAVVRCSLDGAQTFQEALRSVRDASLDAQENARLPYGEVIKALSREQYARPDVPVGAVLNVLYDELMNPQLKFSGAWCRPLAVALTESRPRSTLMVIGQIGAGQLRLTARYQADRLEAGVVDSLLGALIRVIATVAEDPTVRLRELGAFWQLAATAPGRVCDG